VAGADPALAATAVPTFTTPHYYPAVIGDTYFNTVGPDGQIVLTSNDSHGANFRCADHGGDVVILHAAGADPGHLKLSTVNCMTGLGPRGGGRSPDGCSWKSGGITRVGRVIYLAIARQLRQCSYGKQGNGLQPSFNASILKSGDGGRTWTNPWGMTRKHGAAPPWDSTLHRYKAMFPGQHFSAPFFIQYGPGNTQTADGGGRYLYAVSTDGYAYNGNYLHLGRVPLNRIQDASAWEFYHGQVGGGGTYWTHADAGATRILYAKHALSQPAIQYVPSLGRYVLMTFFYPRARWDFPTRSETPYTRIHLYTAPKPWGPWTQVFDHDTQRDLWCTASPCPLTRQPGSTAVTVGTPTDWLGFYDPALVQKFVFSRGLDQQAMFTSGDFKNARRYGPQERLYRLHAVPIDLAAALGS
jgi:hypothetical protein